VHIDPSIGLFSASVVSIPKNWDLLGKELQRHFGISVTTEVKQKIVNGDYESLGWVVREMKGYIEERNSGFD